MKDSERTSNPKNMDSSIDRPLEPTLSYETDEIDVLLKSMRRLSEDEDRRKEIERLLV